MYHKLVKIIKEKQSAVCLSLDTDTIMKGQHILEICAPYICMLKIHPELFSDWDSNKHPQLIKEWRQQYNIIIMLDAKLVDVPEISYKFLMNSHYKSTEWADMVTVMAINYISITEYFRKQDVKITTIPVTEMNTRSQLFEKGEYIQFIKDTILSYPGIMGIINQKTYSACSQVINPYPLSNKTNDDNMFRDTIIKMTPGVVVYESEITANNKSRYRTIKDAMVRDGNDIVIIGGSLINVINNTNEKNEYNQKAKDAAYESIQYSKFNC